MQHGTAGPPTASRVSRPRETGSGRARPNVYGFVPSVNTHPREEQLNGRGLLSYSGKGGVTMF